MLTLSAGAPPWPRAALLLSQGIRNRAAHPVMVADQRTLPMCSVHPNNDINVIELFNIVVPDTYNDVFIDIPAVFRRIALLEGWNVFSICFNLIQRRNLFSIEIL